MPRPPQSFVSRLRELDSPFTREQVEALFEDLSRSSISVYLSHAARAGLIEQVGSKRFRNAKRTDQGRPLTHLTSTVVDRLRSELMPSAFELLVVWDDEALAPFLDDAFPEPFVVIEGSKRTLQTAERILESEFDIDVVRGKQRLGESLWGIQDRRWPSAQVFLLPSSRLHATKPSVHGFQVPTLNRLLVTVLQLPALLPETALRMMESPEFSVQQALAASPSKKAAAQLGAFLAWTLSRYPTHPVGKQAERLLPEILGGR